MKDSKTEVATTTDTMPAFLKGKGDTTRGSEGVGHDDMVIPRIELAQALSACVKKKDAAYIEGCEDGHIYNNVTREIYGEGCTIIPVFFRKEFLVWIDRKSEGRPDGPGFRGAFSQKADAEAEVNGLEEAKHCEIVDTAQHFVIIVKEDGSIEEAVISMAKSKMKVSKSFNTLIRINGGDRFSRAYNLQSVDDKKGNDDYKNFKISNAGWPSEAAYKHAETLYESVASGQRDVDRSDDSEAGAGASDSPADDSEI